MTDDKLFSVNMRWRLKGAKKDLIQTAVIMAKTREEATEKFKRALPELFEMKEKYYLSVNEWEDIYIMGVRREI